MGRFDRQIRKLVPSTALLSRSPGYGLMSRLSDLVMRPAWRVFTRQPLPPLRYIVRTGVGNAVFFPHYYYLTAGAGFWMHVFAQGYASLQSTLVDVGSGVGKTALALRDYAYNGTRFGGRYVGFDVDPEMVAWCRRSFPADHFRFERVDAKSTVYNPDGSVDLPPLDVPDGTADLVFSHSLFSHLLEDDVRHYLREARRMLRPGGRTMMTFFCLEDLEALDLLGGRWTFRHPVGPALVENAKYPESAVAYRRDWMLQAAADAGFSSAEVALPYVQSTLLCVR